MRYIEIGSETEKEAEERVVTFFFKLVNFLQVCDMTSAIVIKMTVTSDCAVLSFLQNTL